MNFKVLLDANVILTYILKREDYENTRQVFSKIVAGEILAFTSPSIFHIVSYWLQKVYEPAVVKTLLTALLEEVRILEMNHAIIQKSLLSQFQDIEDAIQYEVAVMHGIDIILTYDQGFIKQKNLALAVLTPREFLKTN